jgi:hypothetical protein
MFHGAFPMLMDVIWEQPYQSIFLDVHYLFLCAADTQRERERARKACHDWSRVFTGYEVLLCFL